VETVAACDSELTKTPTAIEIAVRTFNAHSRMIVVRPGQTNAVLISRNATFVPHFIAENNSNLISHLLL
jgi:hypothetical protein